MQGAIICSCIVLKTYDGGRCGCCPVIAKPPDDAFRKFLEGRRTGAGWRNSEAAHRLAGTRVSAVETAHVPLPHKFFLIVARRCCIIASQFDTRPLSLDRNRYVCASGLERSPAMSNRMVPVPADSDESLPTADTFNECRRPRFHSPKPGTEIRGQSSPTRIVYSIIPVDSSDRN